MYQQILGLMMISGSVRKYVQLLVMQILISKECFSIGFPKDDFDIDNIIEALYRNIKSETVIVCDDWPKC